VQAALCFICVTKTPMKLAAAQAAVFSLTPRQAAGMRQLAD